MCAEFGGIATYARNLLATWPVLFPDDELHVLTSAGEGDDLARGAGIVAHRYRVPRPAAVFRPIMQTVAVSRVVRRVGADAVLATLPSTTLWKPSVPVIVVVYDLRHELRPEQFSRRRRLMRRLSYGRGYAIADGIISISQRSLDDLHVLHPHRARVPSSVAYLGADHVDQWVGETREDYAIAFAHHTNKNPDLVVEAWRRLVTDRPEPGAVPVLKLLGLSGRRRSDMSRLVTRLELSEHVELAPFLPDREFEAVMAGSRLVVFPSDFEGFGLPAVEAMRLGIPVVVGPDRAVLEVAAGHATVMAEWSADALAAAVTEALKLDSTSLAAAAQHAAAFTWAETVRRTRAALELAVKNGHSGSGRIWR